MPADPFDLERFLTAQDGTYESALEEMRTGRKRSHWMWFIFPQLAGLGSSPTAQHFGIRSVGEASAYLAHPILGPRLQECAAAALAIQDRTAREIFGAPDDLKLRSSATLFAQVSDPGSVFHRLLDRFFDGREDSRTLELLS